MRIIDEGALTCDELLICLKQHFGTAEYHAEIENSIAFLSNYRGIWSIGFVGVPPIKTVLALAAIMDSEIMPQCADYVDRIVFNYGGANEIVFDFENTQDLLSKKSTFLALLDGARWN